MASGLLSSSLPVSSKLAQETELQKMLTDERMRGEMHKTNYQTLKAEHQRLQDEFQRLETEFARHTEESRMMEERCQALVSRARKELSEKTAENEELKAQIITPQKLELMKLKIAEDLDQPSRERIARMEAEVEKYRSDFNKLRYEYSFLKQEYEHDKSENNRVIEEVKMQYETELENLRKERETIAARFSTENNQDAQRVRVLQRENAQLHLKTKGLLTELEEIRAQREQAGLQSDHISRMQTKQLTENAATIKTFEAEKESLKMHVDQLQQELSSALDMHKTLNTKVHDLEKDKTSLQSQLEEALHRSKIEITNMKMDVVKSKGELERQRDTLAHELEGCRSKVEVLQHSLEMQTIVLADKEKEITRKIQATREEEWEKTNKLENEKLELEAKLQEIDRRKMEEESRRTELQERTDDRIKQVEAKREEAEKECLVLKTKLEQRHSVAEQLEKETQQTNELREKIHTLRTELQGLQGMEQELLGENEKLKHKVDLLSNELNLAAAEVEKTQEATQGQLDQQRIGFMDEKQQMQTRLTEFEQQIQEMHGRLHRAGSTHKKKKKKYAKLLKHQKEKIQVLKAKLEEMEIERQSLNRQNVPHATYTKLKRQLRDLYQRHTEFRQVILNGISQMTIGDFKYASVPFGVDASPLSWANQSGLEHQHQHQRDLMAMKERLDNLDDNQRQQLDDLVGNLEPSKIEEGDKENISTMTDKQSETGKL
ncbi:centrosomal protein of 83 kDa-like [Glandiceps talaboti]